MKDVKPVLEMSPSIRTRFDVYPNEIRARLMRIRRLIFAAAADNPDIGELVEALRWGEPAYLAKKGSTVRIGWQESALEYYAVYFNCNTKLVDTFREIYSGEFDFEGNRAIVFHKDEDVPSGPLKHCLELALRYHRIKHLPLLGA